MSATQSELELPPALPEPKPVDFKITIHSIEGLKFLTELGNNQLAASILFPTHSTDTMSPLFFPSSKILFEYSEEYSFQLYPLSTINALLANPLELFLYICTPDMKKQTQVVHFIFPFDQLFFNDSYLSSVEGKVLLDGQSVISPDGIKANIECSWSKPIFDHETQQDSLIATFNVQSLNSPPLAMVNCSTQPNNLATHIFTYTLFAELPDNQVFVIEEGKFQSTSSDGSDALIQFNSIQKFLIQPDGLKKWKDLAESDQVITLYLKPELSPLIQPLGIPNEQFSALCGFAEIPLSHFAKAGRSHFQASIPIFRDEDYTEHLPGSLLLSPTGFPPEPTPEASKKKTLTKKPTPSARIQASTTSKNGKQTPTKKPRALTAKDKKLLAQLQTVMKFDEDKDYFKESTTSLKLEITLSRPIIPRPATPASSKTPEEIIKPLPKMHEHKLADATEEFCRQINIAIDKLEYKKGIKGEELQNLKMILKEGLKPSIVDIVKNIFLDGHSLDDFEISPSFIAELRSFLILNVNRVMNYKYDLSYPRPPPHVDDMDSIQITNRIHSQTFHKTDDLETLYIKRCEVDPSNPQWLFELALYYNDIKSPKALECFAQAISIDYNFTAAILGFCAQLALTGNREDCIVLLNMLANRKPNDPTVTVCLSILYQLIESSKSDEYLSKVSLMSSNLPKSPNIIAATSLLDVHDTYISEIVLTREQLQCQVSKELLVLLAKFTQQNGEFSRAQEYLKESLEADHENLNTWKMLGEFQYASCEYEKALISFEQMLALADKPDPEVCLRHALIDLLHGNYAKSFDLLIFTVQQIDIALAWTALGVCCLRMGDLDECEVALTKANEMDKWDPTTWGYCAILCCLAGRMIEGEQALVYAKRLHLRDYRLIGELIRKFETIATGEETINCISELRQIKESDCHASLEPDNAENAYLEHNEEEAYNDI
ncbi:TPR Domain containing protein [Tritrichomonas foetus]|uniref:TPR Domain containing protein n=1 Tax=Tritrichomonas foetus TaxID=1144522 RepID=A0A1J4KL69_9EUKA|nr:TPR Domain containing protein [Tritrichomonas foetus]|eukprot:OHT12041.1 TPR Domain containing protein [Tritrichomonas foetus]